MKWSQIQESISELERGFTCLISNATNKKIISRLGYVPQIIGKLSHFTEFLRIVIFQSFRRNLPFTLPNEILIKIITFSEYDPSILFLNEEFSNEARFKEDFYVILKKLILSLKYLQGSHKLSLATTVNNKLDRFEEDLKTLDQHLSVFSKLCSEVLHVRYGESSLVST